MLCSLRNANGSFSVVVALHLPRTGENVIYLHEKRQVAAEEYREVQDEGLHFLESMGFMLDNLNFRNMGPAHQEDDAEAAPALPSPPAGPGRRRGRAGRAAEAIRVARLLSSF